MHDGLSTEAFSAAQARITSTLDQDDRSAPKPLIVAGYCAECGTWDAHGLVCSACGYDFGGSESD